MKMTNSCRPVNFDFPYFVGGQIAAEFEARARGVFNADGDLEDYTGIEVLAGGSWEEPDWALRTLILTYLRENNVDGERFIEAARESAGPDPDLRRNLQEFDMGRVVWDPEYRANVRTALLAKAVHPKGR